MAHPYVTGMNHSDTVFPWAQHSLTTSPAEMANFVPHSSYGPLWCPLAYCTVIQTYEEPTSSVHEHKTA